MVVSRLLIVMLPAVDVDVEDSLSQLFRLHFRLEQLLFVTSIVVLPQVDMVYGRNRTLA